MPEVQVRSRGLEPRLYAERLAPGELAAQVLLEDQLVRATSNHLEVLQLTH